MDQEVLRLLAEWGWHAAPERLERVAADEPDPVRRGSLLLLAGWLAVERGLYPRAEKLFKPLVKAGTAKTKAKPPQATIGGRVAGGALTGQAFIAFGLARK